MVDRRLLKNFDTTLLLSTLGIIIYGCAMIYSAKKGTGAGGGYVERQVMYGIIGLIGAIIAASIDHSVYHRYCGRLYVLNIILLLAVIFMGDASKGAQRWLILGPIRIQPSEFAKLIMIVAMAVFLVKRISTIRTFKTFAESFLYLALPMGLIFKQPDLGTSLVLVAIWLTMIFIMGTDMKNILVIFAAGAVLGTLAWYGGILKPYQKQRVLTLINPASDSRGTGYHVLQSRIAIGSGQMLGKGFLKGTQRELRFVPENHTDFIFTVVGEELGFVGAGALLLLYFLVVWRGLSIVQAAEDDTGRAIGAGIVGMFIFHIIVNIGMTLGIMPVTGVPLPMFSSGGSSLMANIIAIGMLEGISMRRHRISF